MSMNTGQNNLIGLMTDENPNQLTGIIGILKSGNAFVPIDPDSPPERIEFILRDCQIEILVTEAKHLNKARQLSRGDRGLKHIISIDPVGKQAASDDAIEFHDLSSVNGHVEPVERAGSDPGRTAYLVYTSGSTGRPKGVPLTHTNLFPLLQWSRAYFNFDEHTRTLQTLSYCFDFGIFEKLITVLFGGTIWFLDKHQRMDPSGYVEAVKDYSINTINATPTIVGEIASCRVELETLEVLHLGGEALTSSALDEMFEVVGESCIIYNGYGPTETAINSTMFEVGTRSTGRQSESLSVPIGKSNPENHLYVLDGNLNMAPDGVPGELYIGGPGLSPGYLNLPDLTAERFISSPFSAEPGERLYRTGDLVRRLPDGNLDFIGRLDHQVKVRGFRIELGEIEAALGTHPTVREAIVMAREDAPSNKRLVAYVTGNGERPNATELRYYLKQKLPYYMVPSVFVILDEFPLTPNGKIHRRALPAPDASTLDLEEVFLTPRTPEEELVAEICAEVLGLEAIGISNDLFNLGCQSILATRIIARLREAFEVELPLVAIFEGPTVASLAQSILAARNTDPALQAPTINPAPRDGQLPLSFAQERLWFLNQLDPDSASYHVPRAVRITGPFRLAALEHTFTEMVRRQEILRTTFAAIDGLPLQVIHPPYYFNVPLIDLRSLPENEREAQVERLAVETGQRPFDLANGPMIRVVVLQLSEQEHVMILTEHHLVHDGWTQGVFVREFLTLYSAFAPGKPSPLSELSIQYADFACWQRQWLQGEALERQLSYWRNQLAGAPPFLELPADLSRPATQSFRGSRENLNHRQ